MPRITAEPFVIAPPAELLGRHAHLRRLASDLSLAYVHHKVVTDDALKAVGGALWQALDREQGLGEALEGALLALPWEALHHPEHGFLARSEAFALSRQTVPAAVPEAPSGPLEVLLFTALPDDLDAERARLDTEGEQTHVLEALDPHIQAGRVRLITPDDGRFEHLRELLAGRDFHLVILSGHGVFREGDVRAGAPGAWFLFEGPDGGSEEVEAGEVAVALKGRGVRAVVLSACETGKAGSEDLSAGFATRLLAAGVPVVVGMAESVYESAGMVFSRALADALASGERPDLAVQAARAAIARPFADGETRDGGYSATAELTQGQWALPVVYARDPAAPLID
jgi:hypothetical protein